MLLMVVAVAMVVVVVKGIIFLSLEDFTMNAQIVMVVKANC